MVTLLEKELKKNNGVLFLHKSGVLIYEMLVGRSPFYSYGTDQVSLFKRIVQVKYSFPHGGMVHDMAQDLIQRLIVRHYR